MRKIQQELHMLKVDDSDKDMNASNEDYIENTYTIRPPIQEKFNKDVAMQVVKSALIEHYEGKIFGSIDSDAKLEEIETIILDKLIALGWKSYKFCVVTTVAEKRGQGLLCNSRQFWDPDTDGIATEFFINESMIVFVQVFAVYHY